MADTTEPVNLEEHDPQFEPVLKLTEQVETKTHEEDEDAIFKMRAKLFRFETGTTEWKERGTGDVRLLQHKETKRIRLVMRRDKTLKLCANHAITADMRLQPNVGSDRSWVWKVAADYADNEPVAETLAIRFANSENAQQFKTKFEEAQKINADIGVESKVDTSANEVSAFTESVKESQEETGEKIAPSPEDQEGTNDDVDGSAQGEGNKEAKNEEKE